MTTSVTEGDVIEMISSLSNWGRWGADDQLGTVNSITHIDTLAHYFWQGQMYNGRSANLITSREGAQVESVDLLRDGSRAAACSST